jgi:hypothetical protein|tara:strand:+ start:320 stop:640 length:321 start_codon:yes stop_codon:yes gene_type:complete
MFPPIVLLLLLAGVAAAEELPPSLPPARLLRSVANATTGLRTDTFVKPLGRLEPGEVINTRPWGPAGSLLRPDTPENASILIVAIEFDLVSGETRESLPLDTLCES